MPRHATPSDIPTPSTAFKASDHAADGKHHILLAATGSVATIKIPHILAALAAYPGISIRLMLTASSLLFLPPLTSLLAATPNLDGIHLDHHEWPAALSPESYIAADPLPLAPDSESERDLESVGFNSSIWTRVGDPILHIELRRWADILLVAPLSANSLAKIVNGFSDNLLLSVVRAWDTAKPIACAPAMNTLMWEHPVTAKQIAVLESEWSWFTVLRPVEKVLACGDSGSGAMREWTDIVQWLVTKMKLEKAESDQ
ncbi:hypothetical protein Dda_4582 [Drechslerella dactyloides]|uniref:Flavoprotein domain-containing protein n=1 Tax=Drechslerella dactyloides TaxID=74499 RepID=A0AAD6J1E1_DREDA|nr:hypothetical protein Dda_4582 [Drechslerella dactyloides]